MVRVILPYQLQVLAGTGHEVELAVKDPVTLGAVLNALENRYPMLRGAVLEHETRRRRPLLRFFACREDLSLEPMDSPVPEAVAVGREPFIILGAIAGG